MIFDTRKMRRVSPSAVAHGLCFAAFIAVAVLIAVSPARAQAPQEDTNPLNSVLGFVGMQFDKEDAPIAYRARAPLVVPPKLDLPPPKQVAHGADWPKDPTIEAQAHEAAASQRPAPQVTPNTRVEMSANELQRQRDDAPVPHRGAASSDCQASAGTPSCVYAPWDVLKSMTGLGGAKAPEVRAGDPEPPRDYLTDPPPGYRAPTATVSASQDIPKEQPDAADAQAYVRSQQHKTSVDN